MKKQHIIAWCGVLTRFFTVQLIVQLGTAVAGIAVIRILTKPEYAFYSIATSFMFAATALTDCGIGVALTALGGRIWQDGEALGQLVNSALSIRKWFVGIVVIGIGVTVPLLLLRNGAKLLPSVFITSTLIFSLVLQVAIGIYGVVPKLRANYRLLQNAALFAIAIRLCIIGLLFLCFANATTAMIANCAGFGVQLWMFRRTVAKEVNLHAGTDKQMTSEILGIVRRQVPYELYGAVSGQLSVLLISVFGNNGRVADLGALGRLAMIFTAMSGVLSNVLLPRFARCQEPGRLRTLFWKILTLYSGSLSVILLIAWLFPSQLVSILGRSYSNLGGECLLAVGGSVVGSLLTAVWGLNISRGWIVPAWIGVTAGVAAQICGILIFDIRTVHGVLLMSLSTNCAGLILHSIASAYFFRSNESSLLPVSSSM